MKKTCGPIYFLLESLDGYTLRKEMLKLCGLFTDTEIVYIIYYYLFSTWITGGKFPL